MDINQQKPKTSIPKQAKRVFKGAIFDVYQWEQQLYDGSTATFEKLERVDTVGVIPITKEGNIILTHEEQPGKGPFLSIPGGRVDAGENIEQAARRELHEETGYEARELVHWYSLQPYHKIVWTIHTFIAKGCTKVAQQTLDAGEKIELKEVTVDQFIGLLCDRKLYIEKEMVILALQAKLDSNKMTELKQLLSK